MSKSNDAQPEEGREIVKMFRKSVGPYNKGEIAIHPQLYSGLYHRATEIKALDKIVGQLTNALQDSKSQNYSHLPIILDAIKSTLNGNPQLSWWTLFTVSVGHALTTSNDEEKNKEEKDYLIQISNILTEIIRHYKASNTKLLLEIRLTALEVDSRLVELEKIPHDVVELDETLDYLASEFTLLTNELDRFISSPKENDIHATENLFHFITKTNQLVRIQKNIAHTNPETYKKFTRFPFLKNLYERISVILKNSKPILNEKTLGLWKMPQLVSIFELFDHFIDITQVLDPTHLYTLLKQAEKFFVANTDLDKKRPQIFSSIELKNYISRKNEEFDKINNHLRAVMKGMKEDRSIRQNLVAYLKNRLMEENDLHHICAMVRFTGEVYQGQTNLKAPPIIQKETLARMNIIINISQPKDLDAILKSFTDEEKETRYFLTQEVILEQFIRWRKQGIY